MMSSSWCKAAGSIELCHFHHLTKLISFLSSESFIKWALEIGCAKALNLITITELKEGTSSPF